MDLPAEVDHSIHAMDNETAASNNQITFPFAFPRTGSYRIWVQVKIEGTVMTAVFDTEVEVVFFNPEVPLRLADLSARGRDDN